MSDGLSLVVTRINVRLYNRNIDSDNLNGKNFLPIMKILPYNPDIFVSGAQQWSFGIFCKPMDTIQWSNYWERELYVKKKR